MRSAEVASNSNSDRLASGPISPSHVARATRASTLCRCACAGNARKMPKWPQTVERPRVFTASRTKLALPWADSAGRCTGFAVCETVLRMSASGGSSGRPAYVRVRIRPQALGCSGRGHRQGRAERNCNMEKPALPGRIGPLDGLQSNLRAASKCHKALRAPACPRWR